LHAAYALACTKANQPIVTKQMFGRALKRLKPELQEAQRTISGRKRWVYLGIGMKSFLGEPPSKTDASRLHLTARSLESLDRGDFS